MLPLKGWSVVIHVFVVERLATDRALEHLNSFGHCPRIYDTGDSCALAVGAYKPSLVERPWRFSPVR
jgi:hypothetical protein